jgi:hypothetical protein
LSFLRVNFWQNRLRCSALFLRPEFGRGQSDLPPKKETRVENFSPRGYAPEFGHNNLRNSLNINENIKHAACQATPGEIKNIPTGKIIIVAAP